MRHATPLAWLRGARAAVELEEAIVGVLVDRGGYLHGGDLDRLRRDLARLRVRPRDECCARMLRALETLPERGEAVTIETVAAEAEIAVAHVERVVGAVWDQALVHLQALEDALLETRCRVEIATIGRALVTVAADYDLDLQRECDRLITELRRLAA